MIAPQPLSLTVNGNHVRRFVEPRLSLADFLRGDLGLTGTHLGCETGACGACIREPRRAAGPCLPDARVAGGRDARRDDRGPVGGGHPGRSPGRIPCPQRAAMRVLHPRHPDRRAGPPRGLGGIRHRSLPGGDPRRALGQLLSLYGLRGHRRRDRERRKGPRRRLRLAAGYGGGAMSAVADSPGAGRYIGRGLPRPGARRLLAGTGPLHRRRRAPPHAPRGLPAQAPMPMRASARSTCPPRPRCPACTGC